MRRRSGGIHSNSEEEYIEVHGLVNLASGYSTAMQEPFLR